MLLIARSIILAVLLFLAFIFSVVICLFRPMHRDNVHFVARFFGSVAPVLGIKVIKRVHSASATPQPCIYLANHQNNFDLFG